MYRDHRKGPGGPPGGATYPGGPHGLKWEGNQPLVGWAPPHGPPPMRLGLGTLGGSSPLPWGARHPPWPPPPPWRFNLLGPPPQGSLYKEGGGRAAAPLHLAPPFPLATPLPPADAWRSPAREPRAPSPPCRRPVGVLPQLLLSPCWIKKEETSPGCTCVERGGTVVRCLDRNQPRSESLRVRLLHPRSCNASA